MCKLPTFATVGSEFACMLGFAVGTVRAADRMAPPASVPVPADYREWTFVTSGLDMVYADPAGAAAPSSRASVFENVFVNKQAYQTFVQNGTWPDKTTFVLELREGERNVSINKAGRTQGSEVTGLLIHAKIDNEWVFYQRAKDGVAHVVARPASCYTCHEAHAAVDTTFAQFYPTLFPIAKAEGVLSQNYLAEAGSAN